MAAVDSAMEPGNGTWRLPVCAGALGVLIVFLFRDGLKLLAASWFNTAEYSHGLLIPFITAYLIWQKRNRLVRLPFRGSWAGVWVVALGLGLYLLGELSTLYVIVQYAFLVVLFGAVMAVAGWPIFREIWVPLLFLVFAVPLPRFLYQALSTRLQLLSSELGVLFIRFCDISVFLEGNVIDLGNYRLQVVEACSGLRYLFPLMSLTLICAYFFRVPFWKRLVLFLSSVPITVAMNSLRVGITGVLVEYRGTAMAEGFLHDFEGWIIFMACTAVLVAEMWLLAGFDRRAFRAAFGPAGPEPAPAGAPPAKSGTPRQIWAVTALSIGALALSPSFIRSDEIVPPRAEFFEFPLSVGAWRGQREVLEQEYVDTLKADDYLLANYFRPGMPPVNLYSAYYASQRKGESTHSPQSCIPGGGWQIKSMDVLAIPEAGGKGGPLRVNRVLIQRGDDREIVYYWFRQRGRELTSEYLVKWYLFWDALTRNRSDGALVRLTTYVPPTEDTGNAERRLAEFMALAVPDLERFIPE
jgi:exosortase D (VPLPA-CTERM-specific)